MARMIPSVVSDHTRSRAEVDVFGIIERELSDEWTAFHSVGLAVHRNKPWAEADFILVGPPGVFVLEVKGQRVRRERGMWVYTSSDGRESVPKAEGPFDQAGGASAALFNYLVERVPGMRNSIVGYGVVTPDIKFTVTGPDILPELVYDADDVAETFERYTERVGAYWRSRLQGVKGRPPVDLDAKMRDTVAELIRPDFDARLSLRSRADRVKKELLRLTVEQYRVLDGLAANDRAIVTGGAGTGKTLLAVEEAARHARDGRTVALVCFNRGLAHQLREVTAELPGVVAGGIHSLMYDIVRRAGLEDELPDADEADLFEVFYPRLAFRALVDGLVPDRYDVVIVDEGQDVMTERYLDVVEALMTGGFASGRWRVFYDLRQDVYAATEPAALHRLRKHGASFALTINCRNTRPIGTETALLCGLTPTETLVVDGPEVRRRWCADDREQARQLGKDLNNLLIGGFQRSDVVVLGPRKLANTSIAGGIPGIPFRLVDGHMGELPRNAVRYSTIQGFKGLEADAVFLVDVDDVLEPASVNAWYVGTTRARTDLFVYFSSGVRAQYEERAEEFGQRLLDLD